MIPPALDAVRERVNEALSPIAREKYFLRRSEGADSLLVTDIAKRSVPSDVAVSALIEADFAVKHEGGLIYIGLTDAMLKRLLPKDTRPPPPFPKNASLLPAYELIRLLIARGRAEYGGLDIIYDYLKHEELGADALISRMSDLTRRCAALIRQRKLLPTALIARIRPILTQRSDEA